MKYLLLLLAFSSSFSLLACDLQIKHFKNLSVDNELEQLGKQEISLRCIKEELIEYTRNAVELLLKRDMNQMQAKSYLSDLKFSCQSRFLRNRVLRRLGDRKQILIVKCAIEKIQALPPRE